MLRLLVTAAFFVFGYEAIGQSHKIQLWEFGFNRVDCANDIKIVAEVFAANANVTVVSSGCVEAQIGQIDATGMIVYSSDKHVEVTTFDPRNYSSFDGHFKTTESCSAALDMEKSALERLTGLTPFSAYCYKSNSVGAPRYRLRMDAVGTSAMKKQTATAGWSYKVVDEAAMMERIRSIMSDLGAEVTAVSVDRDISGYLIAVDFYAETELFLHSQQFLSWKDVAACQAQSDELNALESSRSYFSCTASVQNTATMIHVYASDQLFGGVEFKTELLPQTYASREECFADRSRVQSAFGNSGSELIATVCGQNAKFSMWQMLVIF